MFVYFYFNFVSVLDLLDNNDKLDIFGFLFNFIICLYNIVFILMNIVRYL